MNTIHYLILGAKSPAGRHYIAGLAEKGVDSKHVFAFDTHMGRMSFGEDHVIEVYDVAGFKHRAPAAQPHFTTQMVLAEARPDYIPIADAHLDDGKPLIDFSGHFITDPDAVMAPATGLLTIQPSATARILSRIVTRLGITPQRAHLQVLLPTSHFGKDAMDELFHQVRQFLVTDALDASQFTKKIAFNVIPFAGTIDDTGVASEEHRLYAEIKKLCPGIDDVFISTCVVPVFIGLSVQITMQFAPSDAMTVPEATRLLRADKNIRIIDLNSELVTASPAEIAGDDGLFISRLHKPTQMHNAISFWAMVDNTMWE